MRGDGRPGRKRQIPARAGMGSRESGAGSSGGSTARFRQVLQELQGLQLWLALPVTLVMLKRPEQMMRLAAAYYRLRFRRYGTGLVIVFHQAHRPGLAIRLANQARQSGSPMRLASDLRLQLPDGVQVAVFQLAQTVFHLDVVGHIGEIGGILQVGRVIADRLQGVGGDDLLHGKLHQLDQRAQIVRKTGIFYQYTHGVHDHFFLFDVSVIEE
ncbi:hypothetical protein Hsero_3161 [Herbaspirillum seropedicae SmR1]|uniref:Uncharacterized protein n=1 Tax=Herbaspirillum seropedicae (strain SmR1) TaxID=757424 RepID=D8J174_HERSS|nr:hypothetical protein Hsero_3161 [Herbaspirillum seropedicae SmR1]